MIDINLYEKAIEHFGKTAQLKKWIEELDELKVEVQKYIDGEGDIDHLSGEIADVMNIMIQCGAILDVDSEAVERIMELKMLRTSERIDSGYYNS